MTYTVYSKPSCPNCVKAIVWIKAKGYEFEKLDVFEVDGLLEELRSRGVRELPYILLDGQVVGGIVELQRRLFM